MVSSLDGSTRNVAPLLLPLGGLCVEQILLRRCGIFSLHVNQLDGGAEEVSGGSAKDMPGGAPVASQPVPLQLLGCGLVYSCAQPWFPLSALSFRWLVVGAQEPWTNADILASWQH